MMEREEELKRALARIEPPAGFAERVLARVPQPAVRPWKLKFSAIAAAIVLAATLALFQYHRQQEQLEAARNAQRELAFALRFTADKLAAINRRLTVEAPKIPIEKLEGKQL